MDSDSSSTKIDKLKADNYHAWKQKIKHLLALKDLSEFLEDDPPVGDLLAAWKKKDMKAQAVVGLTLPDELLENVREVKTAKEMWQSICDVFERHTLLNKLSARRKFYTATKQEEESVLQFSNRIRQLAATLKSMSVTVDESEMAMAMLNGLPDAYDPLISALDAIGGQDEKLEFDYVKSRVIQEEQRSDIRAGQAATRAESAALVSQRKERPVCTHCKKKGHLASKCWELYPHLNPRKNNNTNEETAFFAKRNAAEDLDVVCLLAKLSNSSDQVKVNPEINWIIDSGCSNHMTHDKNLFSSYSAVEETQFVELGNNDKARIVGKGTVRIQIKVNGVSRTCVLMEAMHVPELGFNLVSVPALDKKKLSTTFEGQRCFIKSKSTLLATGTMLGNLYLLDVETHSTDRKSVV